MLGLSRLYGETFSLFYALRATEFGLDGCFSVTEKTGDGTLLQTDRNKPNTQHGNLKNYKKPISFFFFMKDTFAFPVSIIAEC